MAWKIPLADVDLGAEEKEAVLKVLDSGWLTMGESTQLFEQEFGSFVDAKHAIAVTNATAGLHLACSALKLQPGDEVIVPSLTFVATAAAVVYAGGRPVFADIQGEHDLNISPEAIEQAITPRTRAVIVVHYGGFPCDMPRIREIALAHGLKIIEDAAHAPGSALDGRKIGTWGDIGCFSFFSNKNMTTGEGGMLVSNDDELAARMRLQRSHAMTTLTWDRHKGHAHTYEVVDLGYNYRIDEIRAAIGREQLKKLERNNQLRRDVTSLYYECLHELASGVVTPFEGHPGVSAHHLMPVLLPVGQDRSKFMDGMKAAGIQTSIHYPPIHQFAFYRDNFAEGANLPRTENLGPREVTLPLYPGLQASDIQMIAETVGQLTRPS